jgi:hypothetical protein
MKYTKKQIIQSRTPAQFIDRCLNSKVSRGEKGLLCKEWLKKTGLTNEDIKYARHRHPYWKGMKLKGSKERNKRRMEQFNFYMYKRRTKWTEKEIKTFLSYNKKSPEGIYQCADWVIATEMKISIAAVQSWRRKVNMVEKLTKNRKKVNIIDMLQIGENRLREVVRKRKW